MYIVELVDLRFYFVALFVRIINKMLFPYRVYSDFRLDHNFERREGFFFLLNYDLVRYTRITRRPEQYNIHSHVFINRLTHFELRKT